jgi:hypothetical protein
MNTDSETIKTACKDILQKSSKNRCHQIKKKYFDTIAANKVSIKSPVPDMTDGEWQALVEMWSTPRHKVCIYYCGILYTCSYWFIFCTWYASAKTCWQYVFYRKPVCQTRWIKKSCVPTEKWFQAHHSTHLCNCKNFCLESLPFDSRWNDIFDSCWITFWYLLKNISERRT